MKKSSPVVPLSEAALELVARRFAVLAEPMRLRLLHALCDGERHVSALVEAVGASQTNVSRHLQVLATHGLVTRRREGVLVFYTIADPTLFELCQLVCGSLQRQHESHARALG